MAADKRKRDAWYNCYPTKLIDKINDKELYKNVYNNERKYISMGILYTNKCKE